MNRRSLTASSCTLAIALVLTACGPSKQDFGSLEPGASSGTRYRSGLEVPPDLVDTTSESVLAKQAAPEPTVVLPEIENLNIERNNDEGWLEVNADADIVWKKLIGHWGSLGVDLVEADPKTGIMETDWLSPTNEGEEDSGFVGNILDKFLGRLFDQATALDKYTIQLERKEQDHTRINVAHRGLKKIQTQAATKKDNEEFEWVETGEQPDKVQRALTSIAYGLSNESS